MFSIVPPVMRVSWHGTFASPSRLIGPNPAQMSADAQNRLDPAWLKALDCAVKNALANDLTVILDEHDYNFCAEHAEACRTKPLAFWQQVTEIEWWVKAPCRVSMGNSLTREVSNRNLATPPITQPTHGARSSNQ